MTETADPMAPDASPGAVKSGVRRVNNMPMYILGGVMLAFLLVMALVAADRSAKQNAPAEGQKENAGNTSMFAKEIAGDKTDRPLREQRAAHGLAIQARLQPGLRCRCITEPGQQLAVEHACHREGGGDIVWEVASGYFGCRTDDGHAQARAGDMVLDAVTDQSCGDRGGEDTAHDPAEGDGLRRQQQAGRHGEAAQDGGDNAVLQFLRYAVGVDGRRRAHEIRGGLAFGWRRTRR